MVFGMVVLKSGDAKFCVATYSCTKLFCSFEVILLKLTKKTCYLGQKNVLLIKLSHIQLHYAFLLFRIVVTEIDKKNIFLVKRVFFSA